MDIQKEREAFEKEMLDSRYVAGNISAFWDEKTQDYDIVITELRMAWHAWQAAKAQAVPETQQALNDRLLVKSIREHVESHIAEVSVNDLFDKGWLAAMKCIQNNIDILEAQEPAND